MQSKLGSATEAFLNIGSGFLLSMCIWQLIANPLFGYDVSLLENAGLTSIFTVVSMARSYLWRRFFNKREDISYVYCEGECATGVLSRKAIVLRGPGDLGEGSTGEGTEGTGGRQRDGGIPERCSGVTVNTD